ncbi:MAG: ATP-binding protein [Huintestinicola sp.]
MSIEINADQLAGLDTDSYIFADIRDEYAYLYGHVKNAVNIPGNSGESRFTELPKDKRIILCCKDGSVSREKAEWMKSLGYDACSLAGGYLGWLNTRPVSETKAEDAEQSLRKKFHRSILSKFTKAIVEYDLIHPDDRIAVCISGGKDSMLMAKLFQELKRHNKFHFELIFLVMDPGYSPANRQLIERNAEMLGIPIQIFETNIFSSVFNVKNNPCYLCARMRRGHLYNRAKELGCNKIALGHHYDDVIETILMGMLYGGQAQTMMPKLHSSNFEGMELIRPLYLVREEDIKHWRDYNDLHFIQCACKFTESCAGGASSETDSKRLEIKHMIAGMKKINPQVEMNIFRSVENVNLKTLISYKDHDGNVHHFLDGYDGRA